MSKKTRTFVSELMEHITCVSSASLDRVTRDERPFQDDGPDEALADFLLGSSKEEYAVARAIAALILKEELDDMPDY